MNEKEYAEAFTESEYNDDCEIISSWPFRSERPKQPKILENTVWYVDDSAGMTVAEFNNSESAYWFLENCCNGGRVRKYSPTPEEYDKQQAVVRKEKRYQRGFG